MTSSESSESYVCEICSKTFAKRIDLRNHFTKHKRKSPTHSTKPKFTYKRILLKPKPRHSTNPKFRYKWILPKPEPPMISNTRNNYMDTYQKTLELARELSQNTCNSNKISSLNTTKKVAGLPTAVIAPMNFTGTQTKYTIPKKKSTFVENPSDSGGLSAKKLSTTMSKISNKKKINLIENFQKFGKNYKIHKNPNKRQCNSTARQYVTSTLNSIQPNSTQFNLNIPVEIPAKNAETLFNSSNWNETQAKSNNLIEILPNTSAMQTKSPTISPNKSAIQDNLRPIPPNTSEIKANSHQIGSNSSVSQGNTPPIQHISGSSLRLDPRLDPSLKRKIPMLNAVECDQILKNLNHEIPQTKKSKKSIDKIDDKSNCIKLKSDSQTNCKVKNSKKTKDGDDTILKPQMVKEHNQNFINSTKNKKKAKTNSKITNNIILEPQLVKQSIVENNQMVPLQEFQAIDNIINNANSIDTLIVDFPDNEVNILPDHGTYLISTLEMKQSSSNKRNNLVCPTCQRCFKNQTNLNYHKRIHNQNNVTSTTSVKDIATNTDLEVLPKSEEFPRTTHSTKLNKPSLVTREDILTKTGLIKMSRIRRSKITSRVKKNKVDHNIKQKLSNLDQDLDSEHSTNLITSENQLDQINNCNDHTSTNMITSENQLDQINNCNDHTSTNMITSENQLDQINNCNDHTSTNMDSVFNSNHGQVAEDYDIPSHTLEKDYDISIHSDHTPSLEKDYDQTPPLEKISCKCDFSSKSFPKRIQMNKRKSRLYQKDQNLIIDKVSKEHYVTESTKTDDSETFPNISSEHTLNTNHISNIIERTVLKINHEENTTEKLISNVYNRTRNARKRKPTEKLSKLENFTKTNMVRDQKCQICSKMFSRAGLFRHMVIHDNTVLNFKCAICLKAFKRKGNLNRHFQATHGKSISEPNFEYICSKCTEIFDCEQKLFEHVETECNNTPINILDKEFLASLLLTRKKLKKKRAKPNKCTKCGKRFKSMKNFSNHQRMHKRLLNRYYKCRYCGKFYVNLPELRKHKVEHKNEVMVEKLQIKHEPKTEGAQIGSNFFNELPFVKQEPSYDQNESDDLRSSYQKQYSSCLEAVMPKLDIKNEDAETDISNYTEAYWILPFTNFNLIKPLTIKKPFSCYRSKLPRVNLKDVYVSVLRISAESNGPIECKVPASYLNQFSKTLAIKIADIKHWI